MRFVPGAALAVALFVAGPAPLHAQQPARPPASDSVRCAHGPADDEAVMVSAELPDSLGRVAAAADSVLRAQGYALDTVETRPGQLVTTERFDWPPGTEGAAWHGERSPGVQVVVDLEPFAAGSRPGTRLRVAASAVCVLAPDEAPAAPAEVERKLETSAAVQVGTAIAQRFARAGGE